MAVTLEVKGTGDMEVSSKDRANFKFISSVAWYNEIEIRDRHIYNFKNEVWYDKIKAEKPAITYDNKTTFSHF